MVFGKTIFRPPAIYTVLGDGATESDRIWRLKSNKVDLNQMRCLNSMLDSALLRMFGIPVSQNKKYSEELSADYRAHTGLVMFNVRETNWFFIVLR